MLNLLGLVVLCGVCAPCRTARDDDEEAHKVDVRTAEQVRKSPDAIATSLSENIDKVQQRQRFSLERQLAARIEAAEAREVLRNRRVSFAIHVEAAHPDTKNDEKSAGNDTAAEKENSKEAFAKAREDSEKVKEDVGKVEAATHDAQEKSKAVDKDFAQYDEKIKELDDTLGRLSQKTFRWQQEIMQYFADAEADKYSPLMGVKLDRSRDVRGQNSTQDAGGQHSTSAAHSKSA